MLCRVTMSLDGYIAGRTTTGAPYGGVWTGPVFVLAASPDPAPAGFQFVSGDLNG